MSSDSDSDYLPLRKSSDRLEDHRRITRSFKKDMASKISEKPNKKAVEQPMGYSKSVPNKKPKLSKTAGREGAPNSLSSPYLTPEELHELYLKFKRDGHFFANPVSSSPPPLVISRSTDGNFVTTKIECYKTNQQLVRDLTTNFMSHRTGADIPVKSSTPTSVTFTTPVARHPCENRNSVSTSTRVMDNGTRNHGHSNAMHQRSSVINPMYVGPNSWPSFRPTRFQNVNSSGGINFSNNNHGINPKDSSLGSLNQSYQYNNNTNFNKENMGVGSIANTHYPAYSVPNSFDSSHKWGENGQNFVKPGNTVNYIPPNNCTVNSGCYSSIWNNDQSITNPTASQPNYKIYENLNGSQKYETGTRYSTNKNNIGTNVWFCNNQADNFYEINGESSSCSSLELNCFPVATNNSDICEAIADPQNGGASDLGSENLRVSPNIETHSTIPYGWSFNDTNHNYTENNLLSNNNISEFPTEENKLPVKLPGIASIKNKMRLWYNADGQYNQQVPCTTTSVINSFEARDEFILGTDLES